MLQESAQIIEILAKLWQFLWHYVFIVQINYAPFIYLIIETYLHMA